MKPFAKFIFTGNANSAFDTPLIIAICIQHLRYGGKIKVLDFLTTFQFFATQRFETNFETCGLVLFRILLEKRKLLKFSNVTITPNKILCHLIC